MNIDISDRLRDKLLGARRVSVLTGAGISAESGVPTFRGKDGLWRNFRAEDLATPEAFARDPKLVWEWYDWRRRLIAPLTPNAAHRVIAEWERHFPHFRLITQNVDGLHDRAGNQRIIKLHGDIWHLRCTGCSWEARRDEPQLAELPPSCTCGGIFRPAVVWFGEAIPTAVWRGAIQAAAYSELFFSIGTSALVQPAASLPLLAKEKGAYVVEVNIERTPLSTFCDEVILGPAAEVLPQLGRAVAGGGE